MASIVDPTIPLSEGTHVRLLGTPELQVQHLGTPELLVQHLGTPELQIRHIEQEMDLYLETSSGARISILGKLSQAKQAQFNDCMQRLIGNAIHYDIDLGNLIASTGNGFTGYLSDDPLIRELRDLASEALGIENKVWGKYLDGYPTTESGPKLFARKGKRLENLQFEEREVFFALQSCDPTARREVLIGAVAAPYVLSTLYDVIQERRDEVQNDRTIIDENERASRLKKLNAALRKLELDKAAILFEASHPLPVNPTREDIEAKYEQAKAYVETESESWWDKDGWFLQRSKPENMEAEENWAKDAARIATSRDAWHLAQLTLGAPEKGAGVELYPMDIIRRIANGEDVEDAVRSPLSTLLFRDLHHKDMSDCRDGVSNRMAALDQAVQAAVIPAEISQETLNEYRQSIQTAL